MKSALFVCLLFAVGTVNAQSAQGGRGGSPLGLPPPQPPVVGVPSPCQGRSGCTVGLPPQPVVGVPKPCLAKDGCTMGLPPQHVTGVPPACSKETGCTVGLPPLPEIGVPRPSGDPRVTGQPQMVDGLTMPVVGEPPPRPKAPAYLQHGHRILQSKIKKSKVVNEAGFRKSSVDTGESGEDNNGFHRNYGSEFPHLNIDESQEDGAPAAQVVEKAPAKAKGERKPASRTRVNH